MKRPSADGVAIHSYGIEYNICFSFDDGMDRHVAMLLAKTGLNSDSAEFSLKICRDFYCFYIFSAIYCTRNISSEVVFI